MKYAVSPSPEQALEMLAGNRKAMATIVGCCRIEYSGRAKSFLDYGDRLVIVKPDGTVMVHGDTRREPLNWQPPGTKVSFALEDGLSIVAKRTSPPEHMHVHFRDIHAVSVFRLDDAAEIDLVGEEKDIKDRIEKDPSIIEPGLRVVRREVATESGYIDMLCEDTAGRTVIVEVKRTSISPSSVYQLEAYLLDMRKRNKDVDVRGILCAPRISNMARVLIEEKGMEFREIGYEFELKEKKQSSLDCF
ncbi:MAG: Endonuclease NucS [Methanocella sp. PtaU1.Bin125]|nr:MAG: Endonuclease NucS [Methanocella sp. PtaU1.Bin125]